MNNDIKIPKIIHQIWIGPNKMPTIWMDTFSKDYMKKCPGWQYKLWTEKEINKLNLINRDIYDNETSYPGKADIARYEILYQFGGVYVDADSVWINNKCINDLLVKANKTGFFAANEPNTKQLIANGIIGSVKNHPELLKFIKELKSRYYKMKYSVYNFFFKYDPYQITGPLYFTEFWKDKNITIFPSIYFYPTHWNNNTDINYHKKIKLPKESYMFQYGYTTSNLKDKIEEFNTNNYNHIIFLIIIIIVCIWFLVFSAN